VKTQNTHRILVRMPATMADEIRRIGEDDERPLNTVLLRLLRAGLEAYRADHAAPSIRRMA